MTDIWTWLIAPLPIARGVVIILATVAFVFAAAWDAKR